MAKSVTRDRSTVSSATESLCPGKSHFLKDAQPRSESVQQRIMAHRARKYGIDAPSRKEGALEISTEEMFCIGF